MKKFLVASAVLIFCLTVAAQFAIANPGASAKLSGKVIETMNSGSYTYVRIENKGEKMWVAVPQTKVKVGQQIAFAPGMWMVDFKSKSLGRTFDKIYFSEGVAK